MNQETAIGLDDDQERVARADVGERLYVVAGPGSGKTETVAARIAHLTEEEGLSGESLLIISFSRAAVEAVQRRQRETKAQAFGWVTTLDSLAARLLTDAGAVLAGVGFDARITALIAGLHERDDLREQLDVVEHIIVDEVQDIVGIRADLLAKILSTLPDSAGFTLLGDPLQGIYDFQLKAGSLTAEQLRKNAMSLGAVEVPLRGQYRAKTKDSASAMATRREDSTASWVLAMQAHINQMVRLKDDDLTDWIRGTEGTIAVLTQSNAQALLAARQLHAAGVPAELLGPATTRPIAPWIARDLAEVTVPIEYDAFVELMPDVDAATARERWLSLRRLTRAKGKSLDVTAVAPRLASGIVPTFLNSERARVTVSTIHRAKGLEFDRVLLLDPAEWYRGEDPDAYARSLYVAITRPRCRLFTFGAPPGSSWWRASEGTERATRTPPGKRGLTGFEIRGSDWRTQQPPDADGDPGHAQALLREMGPDTPPRKVEVRFSPYDSTSLKPSYDAYLEGARIGSLGEDFQEDFLRRTGRCDRWPDMEGLYLVGAETVGGRPSAPGVGKNGLWLSPLITGPASLNWRH